MSLYTQYETNSEAEKAGVWAELGSNEDGSIPSFKISRMSKANTKYTKALEAATKPHRRSIQMETMDNDLAENVFMKVFIDTVLLGWKNVKGRDGKEMKFSKENATKLFTELPELYDDLQERAKSAALFREVTLEEEAKN